MTLKVLHELSSPSLRSLAASLREGTLSSGITRNPLQQLAGAAAADLQSCLERLIQSGMTPPQIALLVDAIADERTRPSDISAVLELVISGPDVSGIPTADTAAVMHSLIEEATSEILLVGYAVHNGKRLFNRLAARMEERPELRVSFCLDISRKQTDTSLPEEIVRRFAKDFKQNHWPGKRMPELFYDPRSLSDARDKRSSLHAKCGVIDRRVALITSANFTEAAQQRNIEVGVLVKHPLFVEKLVSYFEALKNSRQLLPCPL